MSKICNRKLAKRIKDNEALVQNLSPANTPLTTAQWHQQIIPLRIDIANDIETLKQHGYDREGNKI